MNPSDQPQTSPVAKSPSANSSCSAPGCCGGPDRRQFLQVIGLAGAAALAPGLGRVMAGPFQAEDFERLIPADKKLSPEWVKSLFERGEPTVYKGQELDKIGMPVGGICAGQLYLGGDGKLWHWDLFNQHLGTGDGHYAHPPQPASPLSQGFVLRVTGGGKSQVRTLDRAGFPGIRFRGEYPIGTVEYHDEATPVAVTLEAFSPFIPLNADDSGLPATVLHFTVKNTSPDRVEVELAGWLENAVCLVSGKGREGRRHNRVVRREGLIFLECFAEGPPILTDEPDFGGMGLALLRPRADDRARPQLPEGEVAQAALAESKPSEKEEASGPLDRRLCGGLSRRVDIEPGREAEITFVLAWHFPNLRLPKFPQKVGRHYAGRFGEAVEVAGHVAEHFDRLAGQTRLWRQTWYDSTLPFWFLDRTLANASTLATSTCYRFRNGRFYGWEGVGCCEGTCTHVWQYAHSVARLFPELERSAREMQDFGAGYDPGTGLVDHRGEFHAGYAADGQSGIVLRAYREHQMSADDAFLKRNWPKVKKALEYLIGQDGNGDGILEGSQHNTLDSPWFGPVAWISSLYLAALRAGEEMAREMGDEGFARQAHAIHAAGSRKIVEMLWNGEYFIHKPDPKHPEAMRSGDGCEIDQVFGQSWAFQVGLGRLFSEEHIKGALRSLWKYNFTPDVGPYRQANKPGRWYAMPGEAGTIMCTFPRDGERFSKGFAYYLNECMSGFEYQVAGHMIWEGLVKEGLAVTRAIHDRYEAARRNPWNEVECGDHYARAMASHGVYLAACGYESHGPRGHLGFAPRLTPEHFRAAFTAAEGWGTFEQKREGQAQHETITVRWGRLRLRTLAFEMKEGARPGGVTVRLGGKPVEARHEVSGRRCLITLAEEVVVPAGQAVEVRIG